MEQPSIDHQRHRAEITSSSGWWGHHSHAPRFDNDLIVRVTNVCRVSGHVLWRFSAAILSSDSSEPGGKDVGLFCARVQRYLGRIADACQNNVLLRGSPCRLWLVQSPSRATGADFPN